MAKLPAFRLHPALTALLCIVSPAPSAAGAVGPISAHHPGREPFAFLGIGIGHSTLSEARGVFAPPYDQWIFPSRSLTALGLGAGIGYRFARGPGPPGSSSALRTQLMPHLDQIAASSTAVTLGLVY